MALLIITGVPGAGKTLYAVQKYIIPELKNGGVVYTNIDGLSKSRISILFDIDIFQVEKNLRILDNPQYFYKGIENNAMVVIDESQNIFSNRDWQSTVNSECVAYVMEHRHHGHKLIFITPHIDSVDAGVRRCAEFTYKMKSFSAIGGTKTVRCAIFDQANVNKQPLKIFTWRHDSDVYNCYNSYFNADVKEKKIRHNYFNDPRLIIILIVVIVSFTMFIKGLPKFRSVFVDGNPHANMVHADDQVKSNKNHKTVVKINGEEVGAK